MEKTQLVKKVQVSLDLKQRERALVSISLKMGAIKAMSGIGQSLTRQTMLALERMKEEKLHEELGFSRYDDFLDQWPDSPMSSDKFYRARKLLDQEGELMFDAMEALKLPANTRKKLKGIISIEGDDIVIGEERLPLTEIARVKAVLKDVAFQQEKQTKKTAEQDKEIKELKIKLIETVKAASKSRPDKEVGTPHGQAMLMTLIALEELGKEAASLSDEEKQMHRDNTLRRIGEKMVAIHKGYGLQTSPASNANDKKKGAKDLVDELPDDLFDHDDDDD